MTNNVMGKYRCTISGTQYTMFFSWEQLDALETKYGAAGPPTGDLKELHNVAAIALSAHHPELTGDAIRAMNMPPLALQAHVLAALRLAYYGTDKPEDVAASAAGEKKKAHLLRRFTRWLFGLASGPQNSGA